MTDLQKKKLINDFIISQGRDLTRLIVEGDGMRGYCAWGGGMLISYFTSVIGHGHVSSEDFISGTDTWIDLVFVSELCRTRTHEL